MSAPSVAALANTYNTLVAAYDQLLTLSKDTASAREAAEESLSRHKSRLSFEKENHDRRTANLSRIENDLYRARSERDSLVLSLNLKAHEISPVGEITIRTQEVQSKLVALNATSYGTDAQVTSDAEDAYVNVYNFFDSILGTYTASVDGSDDKIVVLTSGTNVSKLSLEDAGVVATLVAEFNGLKATFNTLNDEAGSDADYVALRSLVVAVLPLMKIIRAQEEVNMYTSILDSETTGLEATLSENFGHLFYTTTSGAMNAASDSTSIFLARSSLSTRESMIRDAATEEMKDRLRNGTSTALVASFSRTDATKNRGHLTGVTVQALRADVSRLRIEEAQVISRLKMLQDKHRKIQDKELLELSGRIETSTERVDFLRARHTSAVSGLDESEDVVAEFAGHLAAAINTMVEMESQDEEIKRSLETLAEDVKNAEQTYKDALDAEKTILQNFVRNLVAYLKSIEGAVSPTVASATGEELLETASGLPIDVQNSDAVALIVEIEALTDLDDKKVRASAGLAAFDSDPRGWLNLNALIGNGYTEDDIDDILADPNAGTPVRTPQIPSFLRPNRPSSRNMIIIIIVAILVLLAVLWLLKSAGK